jgi:hypothetical protein
MLEESLLKTNFIGRDGFRWWIGQTAPASAQGNQANGGGWGNRFKVRIFGYHPYTTVELPDEDLPWAIAILGCTDGSGASNRATSVKIAPGDTVFGFFLDGDDAQQPAILGVFGRTDQVPSSTYKNPFEPFTGFTGRIKPAAGGVIVPNQANEQTTTAQKAPRSVDKQTADKLNKQAESSTQTDEVLAAEDAALAEAQAKEKAATTKEVSSSRAIGKKVTAANANEDSAVARIKNDVDNFTKSVAEITGSIQGAVNGANEFVGKKKQQLFELIDTQTANIQKGSARMIQDITTNLSNVLVPTLNFGLQALYDSVYAVVFAATGSDPAADTAGIIAQATLIGPVKEISDAIPCIANKVIAGIGDVIKGVLQSVADNVTNFVSCIGDQVVGALMNHIIGGVTSFLGPLMAGVDKILMGFDIGTWLGGTGSAILGIAQELGCNQIAPEFDLASDEWVIGKGFSDEDGVPVDEILNTANEALAVAQDLSALPIDLVQDIASITGSLGYFDFMNPSVSTPGFESPLSKCYAGPPELGGCGGTKVKIFGGGIKGVGGIANAIVQVAQGGQGLTGSVIGVDLVNGGGGYTFPPFVELVDECGEGYGATARSVIDYDPDSPTYQQITDIYIVTEGENYTPDKNIPVDDDFILDDEKGPIIIDGGENYEDEDIITDSAGNEYDIKIDNTGAITKIAPRINNEYPSFTESLEYTVNTITGSGAKIAPRIKKRPITPQGQVKQVIDCISKDDDFVGYVNGEKYYGPFHVHPTNGRKMVGATHVSTPHQYIYDSPEESLGSPQQIVSTTTQIQQVTGGGTPTTTSSTTPTTPSTSDGETQTPSAPVPTPTPTPTPPPTPPPSSPPSGGGGY